MEDNNDLFVELVDMIKNLVDNDEIGDSLEFAREQARRDGMDSSELMGFFDGLEEKYLSDDAIEWHKMLDIVAKVTGCKVGGFKGDKCLVIENEELSDEECLEYIQDENVAKIDLEHINNALKIVNTKLEFIDALNLPYDADGFQNIVRFRVVKLDS